MKILRQKLKGEYNIKILIEIVFLLIVISTISFTSCTDKPKEFICVFTELPPVIDGNLDEWTDAKKIVLKDNSGRSKNRIKIMSLWDSKNLYLAFDVKDNNIQAKQTITDHKELYLDDMVEFLLDPLNEKDSCWNENKLIYHINVLGQKKDDRGNAECVSDWRWNGNAEYIVRVKGTLNNPNDVDEGYIVELSITWDEIRVSPYAGLRIGANFACGDRDGDDNCFFDWVDANPFRSPYAFGDVILKK